MPLTPQDVHSKVFGPTRFRRGYDEAEVDAFLDEVEAELTRLHREIDSLRAQLGGGGTTSVGAAEAETAGIPAVPDDESLVGDTPNTPAAASAQAAAQSVDQSGPAGSLEQQVARTLVLAQRAADEAVRDAEQQAEQLRRTAESEAERVRAEAEEQADLERREVERVRAQAEDEVEQLRAFEREYRTRLRTYLEHQLRELENPDQQVEARSPGELPGSTSAVGFGDGRGGGPGFADHADVAAPLPSDLPTSGLPTDDPAAVPPVATPTDEPAVPPSVTVADYSAPSGVGEEASGEDLPRERRDLRDEL